MNKTVQMWWQSFTNWFNAVVVSIVPLIGTLADELPALKPYLPADLYLKALIALAVGNILIRTFKTKGPVALRREKQGAVTPQSGGGPGEER